MNIDSAKKQMSALFASAQSDLKSGASPWDTSRRLLSDFWRLYYRLPRPSQIDFMAWFRPQHEKLGQQANKAWTPTKEKRP